MDAPVYVNILLPFIESVYHDGHRFMQDNDPKHTSKIGKEFLEHNNIIWWKTPPEPLDINPIENLWHELKEGDQAQDEGRISKWYCEVLGFSVSVRSVVST